MNYIEISNPILTSYRDLQENEKKAYYQWFISQIPTRIKILQEYVNSQNKFKDWEANYKEDSIEDLNGWFKENIFTKVS